MQRNILWRRMRRRKDTPCSMDAFVKRRAVATASIIFEREGEWMRNNRSRHQCHVGECECHGYIPMFPCPDVPTKNDMMYGKVNMVYQRINMMYHNINKMHSENKWLELTRVSFRRMWFKPRSHYNEFGSDSDPIFVSFY
ncbi:hypothetical protein HOLleu_43949 [Holothuria leucospilota]|uniref:Uncharacterized protein n=1 Tax=Holothuria leucospilota TaxID=206669 RepID=A0A9Q1BAS0_HOLLE|nr:hypothetical protein HOLleu_43949 [Holothuria leucospilota]